ncbi:MAG: hypothetical protein GWO26_03430 [Phycisphaerae bacterium]|nr:hypothetical protein [Phycisphaerae bacterium]
MKKKEMLGHSPDDADCYVMGNWGLDRVQPNEEQYKKAGKSMIPSFIGG